MKRYAFVIHLKKEKYAQYKELHSKPWQNVLDILRINNVKNYSIFYKDGNLFSYYEYYGNNHEKDMANIANNPTTQQWWNLTKPCQEPLSSAGKKEWWSPMLEVFHMD